MIYNCYSEYERQNEKDRVSDDTDTKRKVKQRAETIMEQSDFLYE